MCERNLGFEAEHHEKALRDLRLVRHRVDREAKRFGILTTEDIKYAMMTLFSTMMRDQRINVREPLLSAEPDANRRRLRDQLGIYSFQYKQAANAFGKQRVRFDHLICMLCHVLYQLLTFFYKSIWQGGRHERCVHIICMFVL